jgi:hypothetical protein
MGKKDDTEATGASDAGAADAGKGKDKKSKKGKEQLEAIGGAAAARPDPGPLAPWRLSICVAVSAAFTGQALFDAAMTGVGIDGALLRSFGVAFGLWVAVGFVNRLLLQAQQAVEAERVEREAREARERAAAEEVVDLSPKPWVETSGTESAA